MVERQHVARDDVDVGLRELAVAALLWTLAAPHLLDLVAPQRELEPARVLQHVARERDGEVVVQAEACVVGVVGGVQPAQDVHLVVDLTLTQQLVERLGGARLDRGEPVQLERRAQRVDHVQLDDTLGGQELGEAAERGRPAGTHANSSR